MSCDKRLIVALDFSNINDVKQLVAHLEDSVGYYKVGMELFYSAGPAVITYLREQGKDVFLDLKLYDIPNTVANSAAALTRMGVTMLNVHASGGGSMMKAAVEAVSKTADILSIPKPQLIAVTVLTSFNSAEWQALRCETDIPEHVCHLAAMAQIVGVDGVVASPQEAPLLRLACGEEFLVVTPGVRPVGANQNDQSRIATPSGALRAGASHLVIGRPITAAPDPRKAAQAILDEMSGCNE